MVITIVTGLFVVALSACGDLEPDPGGEPQGSSETPAVSPQQSPGENDEPKQTGNSSQPSHDDADSDAGNNQARIDEDLLDQAEEEGTVSVIVTLDIDYTPEGDLDSQEAIEQQRAEIASAQDELVSSLEGHNVTETTRYEALPQIVLTVDEPALRELSRSPLVKSVDSNTLDAPTN